MTDLKIRADRAALADAAAWVAQALPKKKHAAPAMFGIRLTAEAEALTLTAFNYETSMSATIPAEVMAAGKALVAGAFLRQIVAAIKGKQVELLTEGSRLTIAAGRSTYRVGVMAIEDYPRLPDFPPVVGRIEAHDLAAAVGTVEHAAARDEISPDLAMLTAAHLSTDGERLTATATDRFRIAHTSAAWDASVTTFSALAPATSLAAMLKGLSGPLEVGASKGQLGLRDGSRTATSRLFDDDYPRVVSRVEAKAAATVEVDAEALSGACKRAGMVLEPGVGLALRIRPGEIEVDAEGNGDEGSEFVECVGDVEFEAIYNPAFLAEALAQVDGRATLGLPARPDRPMTIHPLDGEAAFVVMPRSRRTK